MIANAYELRVTRERIAYFEGLILQFRVTTPPEEFSRMAGGYRAEIEKMQKEALDYLMRDARQPARAA